MHACAEEWGLPRRLARHMARSEVGSAAAAAAVPPNSDAERVDRAKARLATACNHLHGQLACGHFCKWPAVPVCHLWSCSPFTCLAVLGALPAFVLLSCARVNMSSLKHAASLHALACFRSAMRAHRVGIRRHLARRLPLEENRHAQGS